MIWVFLSVLSLNVFAETTCSKEGQEWHPYLPGSGYKTCCQGLAPTSKWRGSQKEKKCVLPPPGDKGYCVKCGNGKCDTKHFEDHCSCPKDCK